MCRIIPILILIKAPQITDVCLDSLICSLDLKLFDKSLTSNNFCAFKWENQSRKLHADYHYNIFLRSMRILVETRELGNFENK